MKTEEQIRVELAEDRNALLLYKGQPLRYAQIEALILALEWVLDD